MALNVFSDQNAAKIEDYARTKTVTRVISQTPAPGTPVLEGMTIQVKTISLSDVPYHVLVPDAPVAIRNTPLADIEKIVQNDDTLRTAVTKGTVTEAERSMIAEKFNSGLAAGGFSGTLSGADAEALVKSVNTLGLFSF